MIQEKEHEQLSEGRRKEIFLALVDAQDHEMDVAQSRSFVVQRFNVSESRLRQIEREGMDNKWPPLRWEKVGTPRRSRDGNRSHRYGMGSNEATAAINALNGKETDGRQLTVNEARPRGDRGSSRSGGSGSRR
jgi:hypothetical protein